MEENNHLKDAQQDMQQQDRQADPQSNPDLKASDTLLVLHNRSKLVGIVQNINPDGTVQQTSPYQNSSEQILKIKQNENAFAQFYINFYHQLKNPQEYSFFKVTEYEAQQTASDLQQYIIDSGDENQHVLKEYEVSIDSVEAHYSNYLDIQRNQNSQNSKSNQNDHHSFSSENKPAFHFRSQRYLYDPKQINWDVISKTGLSREILENMKALDPSLKGYKTPILLPIKISNDTTVLTTDARIALRVGNAGHLEIRFFPVKPEPDYTQPFLGHTFTKEDQINLQETGNMGRVVDLLPLSAETV